MVRAGATPKWTGSEPLVPVADSATQLVPVADSDTQL
jgi:hypothetical protein